jgi:hypothetical protein
MYYLDSSDNTQARKLKFQKSRRRAQLAPLPTGRIDAGDDMSDPTQKDDPKQTSDNKMDQGRENTPLDKLTEAGYKKTDQRGDDVT